MRRRPKSQTGAMQLVMSPEKYCLIRRLLRALRRGERIRVFTKRGEK